MQGIANFIELEQVYSQTLGNGINSLAVCAANSGEGCTSLACALAERHQKSGYSCLLVDMNLYRPAFDRYFNLPRADWSLEEHSSSSAMVNLAQGYNVLTASTLPAMDFRKSELVSRFIETWRRSFDAIVIDTSPLNALNRNNIPAELICGAADAAILVVRSNKTTESELLTAYNRLQRCSARLAGVVMNDAECPTLAEELLREATRLERMFPRIGAWFANKIRSSHFLNLSV